MNIAYIDCFSGASGDMLLGAFFDAGCAPRAIARRLGTLQLPRWHWKISRVKRGAFWGTRVEVSGQSGHSVSRHGLLENVMRRAKTGKLPAHVATTGDRILRRILAAEGKVHGVAVRHVHLHEVEDIDTVVEVYGVLLALHQLGVDRVHVSPVTVGVGTVNSHHGELPVPAPGTAELLRRQQVQFGVGQGELATPTGAAILAAIGAPGPPPVLTVERIGYGAGTRDTGRRPNLLRVFLGKTVPDCVAGDICQLDAVVDDMSPQVIETFLERAYREGAVEAWTAPVQMKRNRPGVAVTALVPHEQLDAVVRAFLEETTTLGVRVSRPGRVRLARRQVRMRTRWGTISFKVAGAGPALHVVPEFREVRRLAERAGVPTRLLLDEAKGLWRKVAGHRARGAGKKT